jgi:serine O-acetyltransferase
MAVVSVGRFLSVVYADYLAFYHFRGESEQRLRALALPRLLTNPSMHAVILIRIAIASPRALSFVWRNILIAKHSIDLYRKPTIGPGLMLSHPFGIVLGNATLGENVLLAHNVSIGSSRTPRRGEEIECPVLGDRVIVNPGSVLAGGITIGSDSVIGANSVVDCDMPPNSVFSRGEVRVRSRPPDPEAIFRSA